MIVLCLPQSICKQKGVHDGELHITKNLIQNSPELVVFVWIVMHFPCNYDETWF